ncbi:hypothetical protein PENTCL1PPCAC_5305, partial [Pristionchus entomophagus]
RLCGSHRVRVYKLTMDPKANKPSTPSSRNAKKDESDFLEADECRTAVETESLTDARISRVPPPVLVSPRDAWANVAPTSQPRIVPATSQSQADRDAHEIAASTQRALETLRNSSDPRDRLFVSPGGGGQPTPKRTAAKSSSPFKPFSGQGRALASPASTARASSVRTAVAGSPAASPVRTAAARSPDVRTGVKHSARLRELQDRSRSRASRSSSNVRTAVAAATPKKSRTRNKSGCGTLHTASANYEIDLRQRTNSMTGPTTNVSTARTISPAARRGRSPARPFAASPQDQEQQDADYPPLPSEGDPTEQPVEIHDKQRASQEYTPHISRPILFGTTSGVRTARAISPARTPRMLSERTARGADSSLRTSRTPASKSEKSRRTGRSVSPANSLGSYQTDHSSRSKKGTVIRASKARSQTKSQPDSSLRTTSARSFGSKKSWVTAQTTTPRRKMLPRSAHKSASETPVSMTARSGCDFSSKSGASRASARRTPHVTPRRAAQKKPTTPLRTAANVSSARSQRTAISPDTASSKRTPTRPAAAAVRPHTPDTPAGWPYRASEQVQLKQTPIRIAPSASNLKTAKSPALRSQKEAHRAAKSRSGSSASRRRSNNPTSDVSTARTIASRLQAVSSGSTRSSRSSKNSLHSSKTNSRTFSATTLASARRSPFPATNDGPDMVIETVQTHGNIEIDLCFNFRVRAPPGKGFGEASSPLKPKEVLINGQHIWKKD